MDLKNLFILLFLTVGLLGIAIFATMLATGTEMNFGNLLNFSLARNPSCTLSPGWNCNAFRLHPDGSLDLKLGQVTGHTARIDGLACVPRGSGEPSSHASAGGVTLYSAAPGFVSGGGAPATIRCGSGGKPGDISEWELYVYYTETDTHQSHKVSGELVAKYE